MSIHKLREMIEDPAFFIGESLHPIHQALKIPVHILRIAQMIATTEQLDLAKENQKQLILFTEEQIKLFHVLQIMGNNYLSKNNMHNVAFSHKVELSPNLLLPLTLDPSDKETEATILPFEEQLDLQGGDKKAVPSYGKKKKKKPKAKKNHSDKEVMINTDNSFAEESKETIPEEAEKVKEENINLNDNVHAKVGEPPTIHNETTTVVESFPIIEIPQANEPEDKNNNKKMNLLDSFLNDSECKNLSISPAKLREIMTSHSSGDSVEKNDLRKIKPLCKEYESMLEETREKYESIIQATNLKLFIKESQIEALQERLSKYEPKSP